MARIEFTVNFCKANEGRKGTRVTTRPLVFEIIDLRNEVKSLRKELERVKGELEALRKQLEDQQRTIDAMAQEWG